MKNFKKFLSMFLVIIMTFSVFTIGANAEEYELGDIQVKNISR